VKVSGRAGVKIHIDSKDLSVTSFIVKWISFAFVTTVCDLVRMAEFAQSAFSPARRGHLRGGGQGKTGRKSCKKNFPGCAIHAT
jgi:hypothetical protein